MSSICRPRVAVMSASGGTTGPVLDWLRISMFASPVQGSKPIGGYAIETRNPPPYFRNRPEAVIVVGARAVQQASVADRAGAASAAEHEDQVDVPASSHVGPGLQASLAWCGVLVAREDTDQHLEVFHAASSAAAWREHPSPAGIGTSRLDG